MPSLEACGQFAMVPRDFYVDPPDQVAQRLLGKLLVRPQETGEPLVGRIVELEAYFGVADPSAHSFAGVTARNAVLFGPPGHAYVYFIYGVHYCLNVSCEPPGHAGCLLLRALEPICGLKAMAANRGLSSTAKLANLTSGPGRMCQAFGVTRERDNGLDLTAKESALQIQDDGFRTGDVQVTTRIGITKDADRLARYSLAGNPFVSGRKTK